MNNIKQAELKSRVDEVLKYNDYPFRNREDFCEERMDWQDLANRADNFYWLLVTLQDELKVD